MKTQKGITLIALIITIIVMLILVGVSVSVALNTGLFKAAQGAAKNTEAERINETAISNGTVNIGGEDTDIHKYVDNLKYKSQGYTHKLVVGTESYLLKEDTTWEELAEAYPEIFTINENDCTCYRGQEIYFGADWQEEEGSYMVTLPAYSFYTVKQCFASDSSLGRGEGPYNLIEL